MLEVRCQWHTNWLWPLLEDCHWRGGAWRDWPCCHWHPPWMGIVWPYRQCWQRCFCCQCYHSTYLRIDSQEVNTDGGMDLTQWAHCAGKENPADISSRGIDPCGLIDNSLWLYGPTWLHSEILDIEDPMQIPEECKPEQQKLKKTVTMLVAGDVVNIGSLIKCMDFSSRNGWFKWQLVLRFVNVLRRKSA